MSKRKLTTKSESESSNKHSKTDQNIIPHELIFNKNKRLDDSFFNVKCLELSKSLLGKYLIRKITTTSKNSLYIACKIVEVEAYLGGTVDSASHSFNNKKTPKNEAMFMKHGTSYVYNIYGVYCCLNITSNEENGSAVLLRAVEITEHGIDLMKTNRKISSTKIQDMKKLTNGPSKLCLAMSITKDQFNKVDLITSDELWLQGNIDSNSTCKNENFEIMSAKRVGIDYADEDAINKFYRFYIKDNPFVSVKSKEAIQIN